MLSGNWWEDAEMHSYHNTTVIRGKDFHEVSEEEYYDSLMDEQ